VIMVYPRLSVYFSRQDDLFVRSRVAFQGHPLRSPYLM
jgi:hypothetical protein